MTDKERIVTKELMLDSITKSAFLEKFSKKEEELHDYVLKLLNTTYKEQNARDVEYILIIGFSFNVFTSNFTDILCRLLESSWHYKHEDIVRILQFLKDASSIDCLYKTAQTNYNYLEYNDCYSLIVKCCWALGDINTDEAKEKLRLLSKLKNPIIKEAALEQLNRIN